MKKKNKKQKFINENGLKGIEIDNDISTINYIQQTMKNIQMLEPKTLENNKNNKNIKNNNLNNINNKDLIKNNIPKPKINSLINKSTNFNNFNEISDFIKKDEEKHSQYQNELNILKSQLNII